VTAGGGLRSGRSTWTGSLSIFTTRRSARYNHQQSYKQHPQDRHTTTTIRQVYHVTDTAALVGCAPRDARIVLGQMRAGSLPAGWAIETYAPPLEYGATPVELPARVVLL